jgi:hypothetical protein
MPQGGFMEGSDSFSGDSRAIQTTPMVHPYFIGFVDPV